MNLTFKAIPLPSRVFSKNERGNVGIHRLDEIAAEDLAALCDEFRQRIFKRAGKLDPRQADKRRELIG